METLQLFAGMVQVRYAPIAVLPFVRQGHLLTIEERALPDV